MILQSLALFNLWMIMSGIASPFFIIIGCISSIVVSFLIKAINKKLYCLGSKTTIKNKIRLLIPLYFLWMIKNIIISSSSVLKRTWSIKINASPRFVSIRQLDGDIASMIFLNSITLTPGTISLPNGVAHCYSKADAKDILSEKMRSKIINFAIKKL